MLETMEDNTLFFTFRNVFYSQHCLVPTVDREKADVTTPHIPITNQVRGLYCKLQIAFFPPSICGPNAKLKGHELKWKK